MLCIPFLSFCMDAVPCLHHLFLPMWALSLPSNTGFLPLVCCMSLVPGAHRFQLSLLKPVESSGFGPTLEHRPSAEVRESEGLSRERASQNSRSCISSRRPVGAQWHPRSISKKSILTHIPVSQDRGLGEKQHIRAKLRPLLLTGSVILAEPQFLTLKNGGTHHCFHSGPLMKLG